MTVWLVLIVALLTGCASTDSSYRVVMPTFDAEPKPMACYHGQVQAPCRLLLEDDYRSVILELKSACLALSGTMLSCRMPPSNNLNTLSTP